MKRLENKVAIVTGASSGLGKSMAERFVAEGAKVMFSDITKPEESVEEKFNGNASFFVCDVSDSEQMKELVKETVNVFGGLDVMVNNAGIGSLGGILDTTDEDWDKTISVNLSGVFYGVRAAAEQMKQSNTKGSIINTSSILGNVGMAGAVSYCASKGGVNQITRTAALELADSGIRVNAIAPGFIRTNMTKTVEENKEFNDMVISNTPMGRMGKPEDIAYAVLYLASDESRFTTGEVMYVDGGWSAR